MISPTLLGKIAADEAACWFRRLHTPTLSAGTWSRIATEVATAAEFYAAAGWLHDPTAYHRQPDCPRRVTTGRARAAGVDFEHVQFVSGYEPPPGEPGRERWLDYRPCRACHAWVIQRPSDEDPWLVCIPGYSMGSPLVDLTLFRAAWLSSALGLNVAIPVLPLHGPRSTGWISGDGYFSGDCLDTVHAQAQAVWDVRRLIAWVRSRSDAPIGIYGLSLGGYTAALIAGLDADFDCVIAGIPPSDLVSLARLHMPMPVQSAAAAHGFDWMNLARVFRVIGPLAMAPRVPRLSRSIFAGTADRVVPLEQARRLWRHWQRPAAVWYRGTHLSFFHEPAVRHWLATTLRARLIGADVQRVAA
jgi:hypothetical protein